MKLRDAALMFLSRNEAGFTIAAAVASFGMTTTALGFRTRRISIMGIGLLSLATSIALAFGAARALANITKTRRTFPPPGTLVDVGGYRMHVLAEGPRDAGPPVVWMPGSHLGAFGLHHLHRAIRGERRSLLIDRPGSGWSDPGPFPRTTKREAEELIRALERSGEAGPFVLVGHSFGGLLVANVARRRPDLVAALVLLDATPPDTIVYGPRYPELAAMRGQALRAAFAHLFGLAPATKRKRVTPDSPDSPLDALLASIDELLGEAAQASRAIDAQPRAFFAAYSIFEELSPIGIADAAWDLAVYDGDLASMPVYLVAPGSGDHELSGLPAGTPAERERMRRVLQRSRERYLAVSARSERVITPPGTHHNFPFQTPEFVIDLVRRVCELHPHPTSPAEAR